MLPLRSEKIIDKYNKDNTSIYYDIVQSFLYDTCLNLSKSGKEALYNFVSDDELNLMLIGLRRFTKMKPINVKETRRSFPLMVMICLVFYNILFC